MMKPIMFAAAIAVLTGSASAQPVFVTADEPPPPSVRVSYADLNLQSDAGRTRLEHRIRGAADRLCHEGRKMELENYLVRRACFNSAVADGLQQMNQVIAGRISGTAVAASTLTVSRK